MSAPSDVEGPRIHSSSVNERFAWIAALAAMTVAGYLVRPLLPVDETRYMAVAWEMWQRGQFIVPMLNGDFYDHKPPLLFWLIHAGWAVFGVSEAWGRCIGPLATLACLELLRRVAHAWWPHSKYVATYAPWIFLGGWFIAFYSTAVMFDMVLLAFVLGAWLTLADVARDPGRWLPWLTTGVLLGLAMLTKGPVALVYVLPACLATPWWAGTRIGPAALSLRIVAMLAVAASLPGAWIAAGTLVADEQYLQRVLFHQTLDRISGETGHGRPIWWYVPFVPLLLLPWTAWRPAWSAARLYWRCNTRGDRWSRFTAICALVVLSLIGGKQVHYLVPVLALAALALAHGLSGLEAADLRRGRVLPAIAMSPVLVVLLTLAAKRSGTPLPQWALGYVPLCIVSLALVSFYVYRSGAGQPDAPRRLAVASVAFTTLLMTLMFPALRERYDLLDAGTFVGAQQRAGRPIAYVGRYQGEFSFHGRLTNPVTALAANDAAAWAAAHPDGLIVVRSKRLERTPEVVEFQRPYKTDTLWMFAGSEVARASVVFRG